MDTTTDICAYCEGDAAEHFCARCEGVAYCGKECQINHTVAHQDVCFDYRNPDPEHLKFLLGAVIEMQEDPEDKHLGLEIMNGLIGEPDNRDWVDATVIYVQPDLSLVEAGTWDKMRAKKYEKKAAALEEKRKGSKSLLKKAKYYAQQKHAEAIASKKRKRVQKKKRQKAKSKKYQAYKTKKPHH